VSSELHGLRIDRSRKTERPARGGRWVWIVLLLLLLGAGGWYALRAQSPVEVSVMRIALVQAAPLDDVALNATGYIVAAHKIELAPKVSGRAAWVGVDMGDKVKKDDVLVRLEDEEFSAQVKQQLGQLDSAKAKLAELENGSRPQEIAEAKAALDQAAADLTNADLNLKRTRGLLANKAVSEQAIEDAQATFDKAKARLDSQQAAYDLVRAGPRKEQIDSQRAMVEQAQGYLDLSKVNLSNTIIRAPIDGTVLDRNVEVGEYVTTGFVGDKGAKGYVVSLADLNDLRVDLDISQNDFNKINSDSRCLVTTDAYPDRKYEGAVDQISPEANRQKATILVKVKILKPDGLLRPDMNATVAFIRAKALTQSTAQSGAGSVFVPSSAIRDGNVLTVEDGKAAQRAVQIGPTNTGNVRILKGLAEGDLVIVNPPADLQPGRAVTAKN
jgi:HlyD family secretion protein